MAMTNAGALLLAKALLSENIQSFSNANARLGVGDSSTAFSVSHTDLLGASKLRKPVDEGYPIRNEREITFRARFEQGEANFTWNEWGIFNASSGGDMLLREVENLGTKNSSQVWQFTVVVTITPGV